MARLLFETTVNLKFSLFRSARVLNVELVVARVFGSLFYGLGRANQ